LYKKAKAFEDDSMWGSALEQYTNALPKDVRETNHSDVKLLKGRAQLCLEQIANQANVATAVKDADQVIALLKADRDLGALYIAGRAHQVLASRMTQPKDAHARREHEEIAEELFGQGYQKIKSTADLPNDAVACLRGLHRDSDE
jgi:hypothetical protein